MELLFGAKVVAIMALVRIAVPLALLALVAHFLRRLDMRWHPGLVT